MPADEVPREPWSEGRVDYCVIIYSIASSARASTDGGMARPEELVAARL